MTVGLLRCHICRRPRITKHLPVAKLQVNWCGNISLFTQSFNSGIVGPGFQIRSSCQANTIASLVEPPEKQSELTVVRTRYTTVTIVAARIHTLLASITLLGITMFSHWNQRVIVMYWNCIAHITRDSSSYSYLTLCVGYLQFGCYPICLLEAGHSDMNLPFAYC